MYRQSFRPLGLVVQVLFVAMMVFLIVDIQANPRGGSYDIVMTVVPIFLIITAVLANLLHFRYMYKLDEEKITIRFLFRKELIFYGQIKQAQARKPKWLERFVLDVKDRLVELDLDNGKKRILTPANPDEFLHDLNERAKEVINDE